MKVELDNDESWNLASHIIGLLIEEGKLEDSDRARIRRWKSDELRATSQEMKVLTEKINADLATTLDRKTKSQLRKPDWR